MSVRKLLRTPFSTSIYVRECLRQEQKRFRDILPAAGSQHTGMISNGYHRDLTFVCTIQRTIKRY